MRAIGAPIACAAIPARIWRKSSAFNFSGAVILNALAEIVSVLMMRNLHRDHSRFARRASLFAWTETAGDYVQASGMNKNIIYREVSSPTIRVAPIWETAASSARLLYRDFLHRVDLPGSPKVEETGDPPGANALGCPACQDHIRPPPC